LTLFKKADPTNKRKLATAYPEMAKALQMWEEAGDYGNDLFRRYNLIKAPPFDMPTALKEIE
jgi:hypothetical protein